MLFATTWMDLWGIMLSEIRVRKINAISFHSQENILKVWSDFRQNKNLKTNIIKISVNHPIEIDNHY